MVFTKTIFFLEIVLILKIDWIKLEYLLPLESKGNNFNIVSWNYPSTEEERRKVMVYQDLYEKGYYITSGLLFGGDFVVYPNDPILFHAEFIIRVQEWDNTIAPLDIISFGRIGVGTKKKCVLASINPKTEKIQYITLTWRGVT